MQIFGEVNMTKEQDLPRASRMMPPKVVSTMFFFVFFVHASFTSLRSLEGIFVHTVLRMPAE